MNNHNKRPKLLALTLTLTLLMGILSSCNNMTLLSEKSKTEVSKTEISITEVSKTSKIKNSNATTLLATPLAEKSTLSEQFYRSMDADTVDGMNQFGINSLKALYNGENLMISSVSLELALLMTATGAKGDTREEMLSALHISDIESAEFDNTISQLMWRANQNGLNAANSIWFQKDYGVSSDYAERCAKVFASELFEVDYISNAKQAEEYINSWTSENTNDKIPKIVEDLSPDTRMVLINTLHFLSDWKYEFAVDNTYDQDFKGVNSTNSVPFMHARFNVPYFEGDTFQYLALPFVGDDSLSSNAMSFILPKSGYDMDDAISEVEEMTFAEVVTSATIQEVDISIPKFEYEYSTSMVSTMRSLGMNLAFDDADFSGMTDGDNGLAISDIIHKTYIKIDEGGAEAAAATAVIMYETAIPEPEVVLEFNANRPFWFSICDTNDGIMMFSGILSTL
ncbi:MAG: serpin family protein [Clostridiaceae bacterium]|nr:serpin family protein [Clostridiaceae bacterium]